MEVKVEDMEEGQEVVIKGDIVEEEVAMEGGVEEDMEGEMGVDMGAMGVDMEGAMGEDMEGAMGVDMEGAMGVDMEGEMGVDMEGAMGVDMEGAGEMAMVEAMVEEDTMQLYHENSPFTSVFYGLYFSHVILDNKDFFWFFLSQVESFSSCKRVYEACRLKFLCQFSPSFGDGALPFNEFRSWDHVEHFHEMEK